MASKFVLACLAFTAASATDPTSCQACTHAVSELLKSVPILSRTNTREGDKELALGDALPSMCVSNVFKGLANAPALEAACKPFSSFEGPAVTALLAGGGVPGACAAACDGVPEDARAPTAAAARKATAPPPPPKKGAPKKGTVDDPAYKAALAAKAKRDAARNKRNAKRGGEDEDEL